MIQIIIGISVVTALTIVLSIIHKKKSSMGWDIGLFCGSSCRSGRIYCCRDRADRHEYRALFRKRIRRSF